SRNPWDPRRTPGGSSGGSAASVASGGVYMATGTDTAGSIRIPSALCGTVGMKPTFGRVSRAGITPLSWGLDHAGPLTRTVADAAACLQGMAGYDARDPASLDEPVPDFSAQLHEGVRGLRIGVPTNYFFEHLAPEVESAVRHACERLASLGARLVDVKIPLAKQIVPVLFATVMPEAAAYHARMLRESPQLYTEEVRGLLEAGTLLPAATYIHAQRVRQLINQAVRDMYAAIDVLIAPTEPKTADLQGAESVTWADGTVEPLVFTYVRFTSFADVTGQPAISVPAALSADGLPIGLQFIGRPLDETTVLRVAAAWEAESGWGNRFPEP
ncbi:MAG TPA: amidase family protein, partial [Nevskiaceae bacterium]